MTEELLAKNLTWKKAVVATAASMSLLAFGGLKANAADIRTVQSGDTIWALARAKYGTANLQANIAKIESKNQVADPTKLYVGQQLDLDVASSAPVAQATSAQTASAPVAKTTTQQTQTPATASPVKTYQAPAATTAPTGTVYQQFIAAGGSAALWEAIVIPESGGNPNAVSYYGYHGLGQTKQAWGYGSVANQTQGMISYAISRYGSVSNAISFRQSHGWW